MSLVRFGDFVIDWNMVYAVSLNKKLEVHADVPTPGIGTRVLIHDEIAKAAWDRVNADSRFVVFDGFAMDLSRVRQVVNAPDGESFVLFGLANGRLAKLVLSRDVVTAILRWVDEPDDGK